MKAGIIGAGEIGSFHAKCLKACGIDIGFVLDDDIKKAELLANEYWINKAYNTLGDIDEAVNGVHICTPSNVHYLYAKHFMKKGVNIICEKPLSVTSQEARELYQLSKGVKVAVNFNNRYLKVVNEVKTLCAGSKINTITGHYFQQYHTLPTHYSWRYDSSVTGELRAVSEIGSHYFDLIRYITGLEITQVFATFVKTNPIRYMDDGLMVDYVTDKKIEVNSEDIAHIIYKLSNGAIGSTVLSEVSHGRNNEIVVEINTSNSSYIVNTEEPYKIKEGVNKGGLVEKTYPFGGGFTTTFEDFFREFYGGEGKSRYATFYDGFVNARILEAVYRSSVSQKFETVER